MCVPSQHACVFRYCSTTSVRIDPILSRINATSCPSRTSSGTWRATWSSRSTSVCAKYGIVIRYVHINDNTIVSQQ